MAHGQTPSQTVGPYFAYGLTPEQYGYAYGSVFGPVLARPHAHGAHIRIVGQVLDGEGTPIDDALVEILHADAAGRYVTSAAQAEADGFAGFGRCGTGASAHREFVFDTVKPGAADGEAPHVDVIVTMRGLPSHAFTRLYFPDETQANARDPLLQAVPAARRDTLVARRLDLPGGVVYRFDIHMQGERETVFLDL